MLLHNANSRIEGFKIMILWCLTLGIAVVLTACSPGAKGLGTGSASTGGSGGGAAGGGAVDTSAYFRMEIFPNKPLLSPSGNIQFHVLGYLNDGSTRDITSLVTWSSSNNSVATPAASPGLVNAISMGTSELVATMGAFTKKVDIRVTPAHLLSIEVTPAAQSYPRGVVQSFTATGLYNDGSTYDLTAMATWNSGNASVAAASNALVSKGRVTMGSVGSTQISAVVDGITGSTSVAVSSASLVSLQINPASVTVPLGTTRQLSVIGTYSDNSTADVTLSAVWTQSNSSVLTANQGGVRGLVKSLQTGSATVTATLNGVSAQAQVQSSAATLVSISIDPANRTLAKGLQQNFTLNGLFTDGSSVDLTSQASWTTTDSSVAFVSDSSGSKGRAVANNVGSVTISAAYAGQNAQTNFIVSNATLSSITLSPDNAFVPNGTYVSISAWGLYSDGTVSDITEIVSWNSSSPSTASVNNATGSKGVVRAIALGTATITATSGSINSDTTITVTSASLVSLQITPSAVSLARGLNQQLGATATYSDGSTGDITNTVTWSSSNSVVASVSNSAGTKGQALARAVGTATITAALGSVNNTSTITVSNASLSSIELNPTSVTIPNGLYRQITATGLYSDGSTQDLTSSVSWTTANGAIFTVSNTAGTQGQVTGVSLGSAMLTAAMGGRQAQIPVTVSSATLVSIAITAAQSPLAKGASTQLTAIGTYSDGTTANLTSAASWSSSDTSILSVSSSGPTSGTLTAVDVGSATVTGTFGSISGTYSTTSTNAVLNSIAISPSNFSIAKGLTQQLTATGTYSDATTVNITSLVTWNSSDSSIASVSNAAGTKGLSAGLAAGAANVSATLNGVTGYTPVSVTAATLVSISVTNVGGSLAKGLTRQLVATGTYTDASNADLSSSVTWSSASSSIVGVSNAVGSKGRVTANLSTGSSLVTATLSGVSGSTSVVVTVPALVSVAVTPGNVNVVVLAFGQLTLTGTYTDGSTANLTESANWVSTSPLLISVSNAAGTKGRCGALGVGSAVITATVGGMSATSNIYGLL